jgi:prevent-host-death family protein
MSEHLEASEHAPSSEYPELSTTEARERFAELIERVHFKGERIIIKRRGKPAVALISIEDFEDFLHLEEEEDSFAAREALKALSEMEERGEKPIPWEEVKAELGRK